MIYADFNATTPLCDAAVKAMREALENWGNPSSSHGLGRKALEMLHKSRTAVAAALAAKPDEVVFTSGGSEANTMVLLGLYLANNRDFRLLTTPVEHSSVRDTADEIARMGGRVEHIRVTPKGGLDLEDFHAKLAAKPTLVSVMTSNNETGVIFPVAEIADACRKAGVLFHTDAVQAFGKLEASAWANADFVTVSAHKIYGPKGIGALRIRSGLTLTPLHFGGAQEIKRRGGTENTLGIAGFGAACGEMATPEELATVAAARDQFERALVKGLPDVHFQGKDEPRVPNTSSVRFEGIPSELLLSALDLDGVYVSAGSACSSGSVKPSHVLLAMGLTQQAARECARFSFGLPTTSAEIDTLSNLVIDHVKRIRSRRAERGRERFKN